LAVVCDPDRVDADGLRRLSVVKSLVDGAAARLAETTEGMDDPDLDAARRRLRAAGVSVTKAAGGLSWWTHMWLDMAVLGVGSWVAATVAGQFIGLSAGWTITATVVVVVGLRWPMVVLGDVLTARVNRWRTTRPTSATFVARVDVGPVDALTCAVGPAVEILGLLGVARDELRMTMRRRSAAYGFGYLTQTAAGFDWQRRRSGQLRWMSLADRQLCQVIYSIKLWLRP
jgi:hypothetical protein